MFKSILFYFAMGLNILGVLGALYFIISDESSGYSSGNGLLMLITLLLAGWIALCFYLRRTQPLIAAVLAWIPALPLLMYALFVLMFIVISPDMK
jgi:hypothetical protein